METNIEKLRYNSVSKRTFTTNVSGKESVDENAKVLCVNATASCGRSEILNNEVIIEGVVKYVAVLKINENIKTVERSERFTVNESISGINPDSNMLISSAVDKVKGYIEAGKIMFSATVNINAVLISSKELTYINQLNDDYRKKEKTLKCFNTYLIKNLRFGVNEDTELSPRLPEINEILTSQASVSVKEAHISAGQLILGGDITVQTVYNSTDEYDPIVQVTDKFDFSQLIDINENGAQNPFAVLNIEEIAANIKPNEQGEIRCIEYNLGLYGYAFAGENIEYCIVSDAYSLKNKIECVCDEIEYSFIESEINSVLSKSINVYVPENCNPIARICSVTFTPENVESKVADSKAFIKCMGDVSVIYTASGTGETVGFNTTVNFDLTFENMLLSDAKDIFTYISINDMQAVLISGKEIEIRAGLNLKVIPENVIKEKIVTDFKNSEKNDFPEFGIIIYNVQNNDCLWDICKNYGVDEEDVLKLNPDISQKLNTGDKIYLFRKLEV